MKHREENYKMLDPKFRENKLQENLELNTANAGNKEL